MSSPSIVDLPEPVAPPAALPAGNASLTFTPHGAQLFPARLGASDIASLQALADRLVGDRAGVRLHGAPTVTAVVSSQGPLGAIAAATLGAAARPVRAVLFDKTPTNNWSVAWHQDRTIAVRQRRDMPGFGPWSIKAGIQHVEPPFAVTAGMITLRAHLDPCNDDNAPLLVAPGSHRLGRLPAAAITAAVAALGTVACHAAAGDIWLYATAIIHASEPARMPQRRRVLQVDYAACDLPQGLDWLGV